MNLSKPNWEPRDGYYAEVADITGDASWDPDDTV